jgi:DNA-binding CsgD family transcriptional regulator
MRFSDLVSRRADGGPSLYQDFFRPFAVEYKLDARIRPTGGHVDFGCCRERCDFSERERTTLGALRPYLTAILRGADAGVVAHELRDAFGLTGREGEVLGLVARGRSNREVAGTLFLSPSTVRKHLEHIYAKLGVRTRTQAVARVVGARLGSSGRIEATELAAVYALTDREVEVLARASVGDSNAAIAATLRVSPETVKKHLQHVYAKLGVSARSQATGRALILGLV